MHPQPSETELLLRQAYLPAVDVLSEGSQRPGIALRRSRADDRGPVPRRRVSAYSRVRRRVLQGKARMRREGLSQGSTELPPRPGRGRGYGALLTALPGGTEGCEDRVRDAEDNVGEAPAGEQCVVGGDGCYPAEEQACDGGGLF